MLEMHAIPSTALSTVEDMHSIPILEHQIIDLDAGRYRRQVRVVLHARSSLNLAVLRLSIWSITGVFEKANLI